MYVSFEVPHRSNRPGLRCGLKGLVTFRSLKYPQKLNCCSNRTRCDSIPRWYAVSFPKSQIKQWNYSQQYRDKPWQLLSNLYIYMHVCYSLNYSLLERKNCNVFGSHKNDSLNVNASILISRRLPSIITILQNQTVYFETYCYDWYVCVHFTLLSLNFM